MMRKNRVCRCKGIHLHKLIFKQDDIYHPRLVFRINPKAVKHSEYSKFLGYETKKFNLFNGKGCKRFERRERLDGITAIGLNRAIIDEEYVTVPLFSKKEYGRQRVLKLLDDV